MALTTTQKTEAYQFFIVAFDAVTGVEYMNQLNDAYVAGMTTKQIVNVYTTKPQFEAQYPRFLSNEQFADKLIENVVGASATDAAKLEAKADVAAALNAGWTKGDVVFQIFTNLAAKAPTDVQWGATSTMLANKVAVAEYVTETLLVNTTDLTKLSALLDDVTQDAASVDAAKAAASGANGQIFLLTKGLDNLTGTAGNDTFIGSVATDVELKTLSALDSIDGGAGVDTLKAVTDGAAIALGTLKNVEIIDAQSSAALTIDSSATSGVTNLNVTKAAGAVVATAGATTDVSVKLDAPATFPVTVNGGNNANVTLTGAGAGGTLNAITVGNTKAAQGDVTVSVTNAAAVKSTNIAAATTAITGGKTIAVTQKAGDASGLVADGVTTTTHAQNAVSVTANAATTTVTVKQDKTVAADAGKVAVTGVAEVATVKFTALAALGTATVSGLTFTASKALTAAEVAQAFANLSASALKPGAAVGDTQGAGIAANGVFTGSLLAGWNSGAAAGDTVTFTASNGGAMATDLVATNATATTTTQGVTAVVAKAATLGVTAGAVNIVGGAALKTVTVDGYNAAGNGISGTANALESLSLSNGGAFNAAVGAATVNLSLENVWATAAVAATSTTAAVAAGAAAVSVGSATTTTLNVKNTGANAVTLTSAATALNVNGSGTLAAASSVLGAVKTIKVTETAGLNLTGANLTALESVDTTGTTGAVTVSIVGTQATYAGGAGADSVTVSNNAAITKAINLGAGDDTLNLTALNTASLNGIAATNVLEGGDGTDTLVLAAAAADATTGVSGAATFATRINGFEKLNVGAAGAATTVNLENLDSINYVVSNGATVGALKLDKMLNNATVELKANHVAGIEVALKDATGTADVVNLIANAATTTDIGLVTVAGVETINVTANDTDVSTTVAVSTNTLTLKADTAAAVNVTGAGNLVLNLDAASVKVASVDASTATGALTLDLATQSSGVAVTVKGGAGKDVLKASINAAAKADVLQGGAGDDTLHAGSNGAVLTGGAGNDLFVLGAGTKEANTYTSIADFQAGDLLQLTGATTFAKLTATLNPATAVFSDYVNAAMGQAELVAGAGDAVWFSFGGNSYVMLENNATVGFDNGADSIVQLTGVANLDTASFNGSFVTVSL